MSQIDVELRKAFAHVGLDGTLRKEGGLRRRVGASTNDRRFSFWVWMSDGYVFREPAPDRRWRRVEDESPEDGTEVLAWPTFDETVERTLYIGDGRFGNPCVTHWMPLPAPPSD